MKSSFFSLSHWFSALFALAFPLFADYIVTVQNGPQPLFQHPVSVELTAEQTAFVQAGIYLEEVSEDGNDLLDLLDYTLDTTGETPRLRWTLRGETNPAQQRFFRLIDFNAYPPPRRGSDLECTIADGFITIHNSYFQLRHPLQGKGGFPQDIQYRESGYTDHELFFFDRLFHPDHGQFWLRLDSQAKRGRREAIAQHREDDWDESFAILSNGG